MFLTVFNVDYCLEKQAQEYVNVSKAYSANQINADGRARFSARITLQRGKCN